MQEILIVDGESLTCYFQEEFADTTINAYVGSLEEMCSVFDNENSVLKQAGLRLVSATESVTECEMLKYIKEHINKGLNYVLL